MFPTVDFIICGQICGLFVTVTILIFFVCQKKLNIKNELYFLRTLITATITCALDIVSVFFNTLVPQARISIIFSKLYLMAMLVYLTSVILYITGDTLNKKKYNIVFWVWTILGFLATTAISFAEIGIVDVYTQGVATYIEYSVAVVVILFVSIFTVRYRNQMYGDKAIVIYIWMASWTLFALIQFFFPKLLLVSFAVAFGVMVIYIKLESIDNSIDRETGLFNWNSYLKYVNNMKLQGQKGSVIYLKPNDSLKKADEKVLRASYKKFNDAIRRRNDIVAFSIRNEYLFVMRKDNLNEIKTFLSEGKRLFPVGADAYSAFYLNNVETLVCLSKKTEKHINIDVEFGEGEGQISLKKLQEELNEQKPKKKTTYKDIQAYIEEKYGFKVHTAYIAEVKRDLGLPMYDAPNAVEELKRPRSHPTTEMIEAIKDALKHFEII